VFETSPTQIQALGLSLLATQNGLWVSLCPNHPQHRFTSKAHEASFNRNGMKTSLINPTIFKAN